jgi:hypothetical protein
MVGPCWTVAAGVLGWSIVWSLGPSGDRIGEICVMTHVCWIQARVVTWYDVEDQSPGASKFSIFYSFPNDGRFCRFGC